MCDLPHGSVVEYVWKNWKGDNSVATINLHCNKKKMLYHYFSDKLKKGSRKICHLLSLKYGFMKHYWNTFILSLVFFCSLNNFISILLSKVCVVFLFLGSSHLNSYLGNVSTHKISKLLNVINITSHYVSTQKVVYHPNRYYPLKPIITH